MFTHKVANMKGTKMTDTTTTAVDPELAPKADAEYEQYSADDSAMDSTATVAGKTDVIAAIKGLNDPDSGFFTSIKGSDFAARRKTAAAVTSSKPFDEHLGETINMVHAIVLPVDIADKTTGEVNTAPRVIIIDDKGDAYHATSIGLLSAIRNLFSTLGEPSTWPEPVPVKIVSQKGRNGFKFFTINLV